MINARDTFFKKKVFSWSFERNNFLPNPIKKTNKKTSIYIKQEISKKQIICQPKNKNL